MSPSFCFQHDVTITHARARMVQKRAPSLT